MALKLCVRPNVLYTVKAIWETSGHGLHKHNQSLNLPPSQCYFPLHLLKRSKVGAQACLILQEWGSPFNLIITGGFFSPLLQTIKKNCFKSKQHEHFFRPCQNPFPLGNICFGRQPCPAHNTGNYGSYLNTRDLLTADASFGGMKESGNETFIDALWVWKENSPWALCGCLHISWAFCALRTAVFV